MTALSDCNRYSFSDGEDDLFGSGVIFHMLVELMQLLAAEVGVVLK